MLSAKITTKTRKAVYGRDDHACAICQDDRHIHVHHIRSRSLGGGNDERNLICLCPTCHAIAHGECVLQNQFPFDAETIADAMAYYIEYTYNDDDEPP